MIEKRIPRNYEKHIFFDWDYRRTNCKFKHGADNPSCYKVEGINFCQYHYADEPHFVKLTHWLATYFLKKGISLKIGSSLCVMDFHKHLLRQATPLIGIEIDYETWEPLNDREHPEYFKKYISKETYKEFLCSKDIKKWNKLRNRKVNQENPYYHVGMFDQMELAV